MNKKVIFIILSIIAIVLGILAVRNDATFQTTLWSQLFWLSVGTIATTFLLNAIIERDLYVRQRKEDQFAFRTFTATILSSMLQMLDAKGSESNQLMSSALLSNQKFAEAAQNTSTMISNSTATELISYNSYYLDVATQLRILADRFVRLYSNNNQEMLQHYQNLQELARRWNYKDIFDERSIAYTKSLDPTNTIRKEREVKFSKEKEEVQKLLKDTTAYLSNLAKRVATSSGMPAIS